LTSMFVVAAAVVVAVVREDMRSTALGGGPDRVGSHVERCLVCHDQATESPKGAHAPEVAGCSGCHLGNPLAFVKERAHAGMEREPGALDTVERTCGRAGCHPDQTARVEGSLMATNRGILAVDRWAFGEAPDMNGEGAVMELLARPDPTPTPADDHLRKLCAGCHLHTRKSNRDSAITRSSSGCSACHSTPAVPGGPHPPVDARIPDDRCLGCHSRSGRIALSYQGLAEVRDPATCEDPTVLHDGRPACRVPADVHHEKGLACIDCHTHAALMGDGVVHIHEEDAVKVRCVTCHGPAGQGDEVTWGEVDDPATLRLLRLRGREARAGQRVRLARGGVPLWNLESGPEGWFMTGKINGRRHPVRPTPDDAAHGMSGHEDLTCIACHAAWAPTCTTCHTRYDPKGRQWDFARAQVTTGAWVEDAEEFGWDEPILGVLSSPGTAKRVVPVVPGMVGDLDAAAAGGTRIPWRLFAPVAPHTTRKKARSCRSCHDSAWALGVGKGALELGPDGPRLKPVSESGPRSGHGGAAWVELLGHATGRGTRAGLRPLNPVEQWRVLRVAPCLDCHGRADDPIWLHFDEALTRKDSKGSRCAGPTQSWMRTPPTNRAATTDTPSH